VFSSGWGFLDIITIGDKYSCTKNRSSKDGSLFRRKIPIDRLSSLVYAGELAQAAYLQTRMLIDWFEVKGLPIHPNWRKAHDDFSTRITSRKGSKLPNY